MINKYIPRASFMRLIACLNVFVLCIVFHAHGQCPAWNYVGSPALTTGYVYGTCVAVDAAGTPYIGYAAPGGAGSVKKFDGTNWVLVGAPDFTPGIATNTNMTVTRDGKVYFAYADYYAGFKATVMYYDGSSWQVLGVHGISKGQANNNKIVVDSSGVVYLATSDLAYSYRTLVLRCLPGVYGWDTVGMGGFNASGSGAPEIAIANNGSAYVAYSDGANAGKITVVKHNESTDAWDYVGAAGFSTGGAAQYSIAIAANGTPYVVYADVSLSNQLVVKKFAGGSWVPVGAAGELGNGLYPRLAIDKTGNLYVTAKTTVTYITVKKFDGTNWLDVGAPAFASVEQNMYGMAIDTSNVPYISYGNYSTGVPSCVKLATNISAVTGNPNVCFGTSYTYTSNSPGGVWSSSNSSIAAVGSSTGVVTAVASGTAVISYVLGSCVATKTVTVGGTVPAAITGTASVCEGATTTLSNTTTGGTWVSASPSAATIGSATGTVTGMAAGTTLISYVTGACFSSAVVTVNITPPAITGTMSVCNGLTTTLGNTVAGGTWGSSSTAVATIDATGVVTGIAAGTTTISYTKGSCTRTGAFTVNAVGAAISGPAHVCSGSTGTFSIAVTGGTWSSNIAGTATVNATTGVVAGITPGALLISYTLAGCSVSKQLVIDSALAAGYTYCEPFSSSSYIYPYTGNGTPGYGGDGGSAVLAQISNPGAVFKDAGGNIYVGELTGNRIRKITPSGIITTIAGTGTAGETGDGGPATAATMSFFQDGAFDIHGNLIYAESDVLRKINTSGIISKIAGSYFLSGYAGDGGPATAARFNDPMGIAVDGADNIYVCDYLNNLVRKVNASGIISTIGGTGAFGTGIDGIPATASIIYGPSGVCVDGTGNIYIAEAYGCRIRKIDKAGIISTVAGTGVCGFSGDGGAATAAQLSTPRKVHIDNEGNLHIVDAGNNRVRRVNASGVISTVTGGTGAANTGDGGIAANAGFTVIRDIVFDAGGNMLVADYSSSRVRKITRDTALKAGVANVCLGSTLALLNTTNAGTWSSSNTAVASVGSTGVVTGSALGSAVISYSAANSCGSALFKVTVNVIPAASAGTITGPSAVCNASTITLASTISGGRWISSNTTLATVGSASGVVTGAAGGTVTISYMLNTTCGPVVSTKSVTVTGVPNAGSIYGYVSICGNGTTTLSDSISGGVWSSSDVAVATAGSTGIITGTGTGNAVISYTKSNACFSSSATYNVVVSSIISGSSIICLGATSALTTGSVTPIVGMDYGGGYIIYIDSTGVNGIAAGHTDYEHSGDVLIEWGCYGTVISGADGTAVGTGAQNTLDMMAGCPVYSYPRASKICTDMVKDGYDDWYLPSTGEMALMAANQAKIGAIGSPGHWTYWTSTELNDILAWNFSFPDGGAGISSKESFAEVRPARNFTYSAAGTWSSSNTAVASVGSATGIVTGVAAGTAVITFTSGSGTSTRVVTVSPTGVPGTITGTNTACVGATTTLSNATGGGVWSSSNTAVATIGSATGIVTGTGGGTATISYSIAGICNPATKIVTITALPNAGTITGAAAICGGTSATFTNTAGGGVWSSSNTSVATVGSATGSVTGLTAGTTTISYSVTNTCGTTTATKIMTVDATAATGTITGTPVVCVGATTTLANASPGGVWSSSNAAKAIVGTSGTVTGMAAGTARITYTITNSCNTAFSTVIVTVNAAPDAGTITGASAVCIGSTTTLTDAVTGGVWSSSNTSVAGIGSVTSIVTGVSAGTAILSYTSTVTCGTATATRVMTVDATATTAAITGTLAICLGSTSTLANSSPGGTWSSSDAAIASVGTNGTVTSTLAGTSRITYTIVNSCNTAFSTAIVTVDVPVGTDTIAGDGSADPTLCPASGSFFYFPIAGGTWSSSNTAVATVSVWSATSAIVAGVTAGTATISYSLSNSCGTSVATTVVSVNPVTVVPVPTGTFTVCIGGTTTLSNTMAGGSWSSGSITRATVGASTGIVTGVSAGTVRITYSAVGRCGLGRSSVVVTVNGTPSAGTLSGATTLCVAGTVSVTPSVGGGTWSSSNAAVATVGTNGVVTGVGAGTVRITYTITTTCGSNTATRVLTVSAAVATVSAITGPNTVCVGATITLADTTTGGSWSSNHNTIAPVTSSGVVTGVSTGTVKISYTVTNGCGTTRATQTVTVEGVTTLASTTGTHIICAGSTTALSNSTTGGTWSSGNTAIATVGTSGIVTGIAAGTVIISYTFTSSCGTSYAQFTMTVDALPAAITGLSAVQLDSTITLSNTIAGGAWSSSNASVAAVDAGGDVTGAANGSATITYTLTNSCGTHFVTAPMSVFSYSAAITEMDVYLEAHQCETITGGFDATAHAQTGDYIPIDVDFIVGGTSTTLELSDDSVTWHGLGDYISFNTSGASGDVTQHFYYRYHAADVTGSTFYGEIDFSNWTAIARGETDVYGYVNIIDSGTLAMPVSNTGPACIGGTVSLSTYTVAGAGYAWTGPVGFSASTTSPVISSITSAMFGVYTVAMTTSWGCTATGTTTVSPGSAPDPGVITGSSPICAGATSAYTESVSGGVWTSSNTSVATVGSAGMVSGITGGTATISYVVTNTCGPAAATKIVTINPLPTPGAITGPGVVCTAATITLSNATSGGAWSSSNTAIATIGSGGVVSGITIGTAIISYTVTNACGTGMATTIVTVNSIASVASITGTASVCAGSVTTLSDVTGGGTWSSGNTAVASVGTSGIVTGVAAGTAVISYVVTNSCGSAYSFITATVNPLPVAGTITGTNVVCTGASITLSNATGGGTWSSSNTSAATIGSSGIVTGVAAGTTTISYQVTNGCGTGTASKTLTVNPLPTPGAITGPGVVCTAATITLSNATSGGTWSSGNTAIATIGSGGVVTGVATGTAIISYTVTNVCGTGIATTTLTVNSTVSVASITGTASVCAGSSTTLSDVTGGGTWSSGNTAVATVNTSGVVTGVAAGTAVISYGVTNSCGTAYNTIIATINPLPAAGTITGANVVCTGATITLSNTTGGGTWSSGNTPIAAIGSGGVVTGITTGTATISYTVTNSCGIGTVTTVVTVNSTISVATITGTASVCAGATTTLSNATGGGTWSSGNTAVATVSTSGVVAGVAAGTAVISYAVTNSCGTAYSTITASVNPLPAAGTITGAGMVCAGASITLSNATGGGTWSSSNTSVATIGSTGIVSGLTAGTTSISYQVTNGCGTSTASATLTVNPLPVAGTITGATDVCTGATIALSNATGGGSWSSGNAAVATIGSGGVVTGVAVGTAVISYSVNNSCGTATATAIVTVNSTASVGAITGTAAVCAGASTTLNNTTTGGTWSSSNTPVATVDASGIVSGVAVGTAMISYSVTNSCGIAVSTRIVTVNSLPDAGTITGTTAVCAGATITLTNAVTGGVWASSNTSSATIGSSSGIVTGVAAGTTILSYTVTNGCGSSIATMGVTVNSLPVAGTITGAPAMCMGGTVTLSSSVSGGVWTSSNTAVATVGSGTGIVTGAASGTSSISYAVTNGCGTAVASKIVTVNASADAGTITGASSVMVGVSTTLSASVSGGTWSASNANATISAAGVVTGVTPGSTVVSYTVTNSCGTAVATKTVSVVTFSLGGITGSLAVCQGATTALSDATTGGTWACSNYAVATINITTGIVTGAGAGTATIVYYYAGSTVSAVVTVNPLPAAISGATSVCINATSALTDATTGGTWSSSNAALGTISATGVVTGIAAGTPVISYTLGTGCYRTVNVTVKSLPGGITGSTGLCIGATSVVTGGTGTSWSSSNPSVATIGTLSGVITGVSTGTSTITFNASTGCIATRVATVSAVPSVAAITGPSGVLIGGSITLSNATTGGVWSSNSPARATVTSGGVVTGISAPAATISYTVTNDACSVSATKLITVTSNRPGVSESAETFTCIKVYPNPTTGVFTVESPVNGVFSIYTLEGRQVQSMNVSAGINSVALPKELAAGVYMCRFNGDDGGTAMVRLVYE